MSQSTFQTISNILEIWKNVIQSILFLVLWAALFHKKKERKDVIAAIMFILANAGIGFLPCASWVRYAVSAAVIIGYGALCCKKQISKVVFAVPAFYNLHCLSYLIANSIHVETVRRFVKEIDTSQDGYAQRMYYGATVGMFLLVLFYSALLTAMVLLICRLVKEIGVMTWQDVILLSVLNFVGSMITNIVVELYVVQIGEGAFVLFDEKRELLWKLPAIAVFIFAGEAALIYFWQKYRVLLAARQKHFVEEQQVRAMKRRLEEAENFYGSIRKVRHEMKNHMANIKGLAGAGQYGEIEDYVRKMDVTMQKLEYKYVTGNAVTDVIINDKCRRAEKSGIRFAADFRYGGEIPVFDLGIILNNLLDNAIEACEKLKSGERFICLTMKRKKQFLLLEVENNFDATVPIQTDASQIPVTTKPSALPEIITEHGIGLENVRDVAERYFGGVNIKVKGNVFHVTVMLQQGEEIE